MRLRRSWHRKLLPLSIAAFFASTTVPAATQEEEERPVRSHAVQLGLGSHFGWLGGSYTFRLDRHFAAQVGLGGFDGSANLAGGLRFYPIGPLYTQLGFSSLASSSTKVYYGPDATMGVDLLRTRVAFTIGAGAGLLGGRKFLPCVDLGVGLNFGRSPDSRFTKEPVSQDSPPPSEE